MKYRLFSAALAGLVLTQLYQNCSQLGGFEALDSASTSASLGSVDMSHPAEKTVTLPTQRLQMVNKTYVATLLREVFYSTSTPVPNLEAIINQWVFFKGGQYGQGCDPYSSYSGYDCGGSIMNANLPYQMEDNTVRQSFNVQACENILGMDQAVAAVLQKVTNPSTAPTAAAVAQVYEMFYRGDDASPEVVASLIDMDRALAANAETPTNRWRAVILQVCESPGWQLQ
ncbi:hypothetical protein [Bdellovibrio svalbardensis]|uniref:Uncharacterized protein n=1 Tax=Bdellovibrio svalbardensis TaxID=2972972 RepID=A0ABT6DF36_9BACT|nr:hypothetical protein [Bdellovibrio svalbardensis]MDG0815398.1 hypothetical protein [Bdellovibrio svalbardensis]